MAKPPASVAAFLSGQRFGVAAVLALAGLAAGADSASAKQYPDPWQSEFPSRIALVGFGASGADSAYGHFEVLLRDRWGQPVPFVTVICELEAGSDFRIASDQQDPRLHVVCPHQTVYSVSGGDGIASFTIIGGGRSPLPPPGAANRILFSLDGVPWGSAPCFAFDLNGTSGVSLADVSLWAADFFGGLGAARMDFDADGRVSLTDLSLLAAVFFGAGSAQSAATYCP